MLVVDWLEDMENWEMFTVRENISLNDSSAAFIHAYFIEVILVMLF